MAATAIGTAVKATAATARDQRDVARILARTLECRCRHGLRAKRKKREHHNNRRKNCQTPVHCYLPSFFNAAPRHSNLLNDYLSRNRVMVRITSV